MQSRRWCQESRPAPLPPYNAQWINATRPTFSIPNSGPQMMKCFSELGAWRYALQMLAPNTGKPSRAACVKAIRILSCETTPAKLEVVESGVLCPSLTQRAFLVKSIFTSKTMCPEALCHPGGAFVPRPKISKAIQTLPISLERASCQRVLPFFDQCQ